MIGMGLGPSIVAIFTDYVFKDEKAIRYSLTALLIIGGCLHLYFTLLVSKRIKKQWKKHLISLRLK
jgi:peptidoglycan biosynthesis protein MviN/MurJ (putative lipid II flippase)